MTQLTHPSLLGIGTTIADSEDARRLYCAQRKALEDATRVADRMWSNGEEDLGEIIEAAVATYLDSMS